MTRSAPSTPFAHPPHPWFAAVEDATGDWRPTLLAAAMLPAYLMIVAVRPLRSFFELQLLHPVGYAGIAGVVLAWFLGLRAFWHWRNRVSGSAARPHREVPP